jgi:hypothetical protein
VALTERLASRDVERNGGKQRSARAGKSGPISSVEDRYEVPIRPQDGVGGKKVKRFGDALRNQQAVERVLVYCGELRNTSGMHSANRQFDEPAFVDCP